MSIPEKCKVLAIGGGPGGSYAACVLAREGIDTVLLEAEKMPRYHIGESQLPSLRHYLRFINLDEEFDKYGFVKKVGGAFKMNERNREGYTDFIAAGGPQNYTWNVIRSEADEMIFRHAGKNGAKIFDGVKVTGLEFSETEKTANGTPSGKPISASWTNKTEGTSGNIAFDYVVDANGRGGILNTKYFKNRHYNAALKNVANWAYFTGAAPNAQGTRRQDAVLSEAMLVGVVMHQDIASKKKAEAGSSQQYFDEAVKNAPMVEKMLKGAKQVTPIKSASDYSYHSSEYAFSNARVVGNAGCFIDPFFSSGVHLAVTSGLSAATTIAASIRGDCDEKTTAQWHSNKTREGYSRLLLVVLSAYKLMRHQSASVLSEVDEDNFDRAFDFFSPVIQGTADTITSAGAQTNLSATMDFLDKVFEPAFFPQVEAENTGTNGEAENDESGLGPHAEDSAAIDGIRGLLGKSTTTINEFTNDIIDGRIPKLERGNLTLVMAAA